MTYRYKFQATWRENSAAVIGAARSACRIGSADRSQFGGGAVTIRRFRAIYQFRTARALATHRNLQWTAWRM